MKKKALGIFVVLMMCAIPYVLYTGKSIDGTEIGWTGRIIMIVCLTFFIGMILFDKKAREKRKQDYGSSNFFVAMFKEKKDEKENNNNTDRGGY